MAKKNKGTVYVMSLAFNLPSEVEQRTKELYAMNKGSNFKHYIVDLGFPLEFGSDMPYNIELVKQYNTSLLMDTCKRHGSTYLKFPNIGVSQNYTQFIKAVDLKDEDILICCDPDEVVKTDNWVKAIATTLNTGGVAWCGLMMEEQREIIENSDKAVRILTHPLAPAKAYIMNSITSCAQWGFSGKFLNELGEMPVPDGAPTYGWIEGALFEKLNNKWRWAILPDFIVEHTETSTLYREYKTDITSNVKNGQPMFEDWLKKRNSNG